MFEMRWEIVGVLVEQFTKGSPSYIHEEEEMRRR